MRTELLTIDCTKSYKETHRIKPFRIVRYTTDYSDSNDRALIKFLANSSENLSRRVFAGQANNSQIARPEDIIKANCYAGIISEFFWKSFLNHGNQNIVEGTKFESASNQIDLQTIRGKKTIEVRSSFPRNGSSFAICNPKYQFDVLGPYHNAYKPAEISKDFYVRTFFPLEKPTEILVAIESNAFIVDLVGGATWDMMWDQGTSIIKQLTPEDTDVKIKTSYRVVPMAFALDSIEIRELIVKSEMY